MMVDHLATANAEQHRSGLIRSAANANRRLPFIPDQSAPLSSRGARERLLASLAALAADKEAREVESVDILGYWSAGDRPRRRAWSWPDRCTLLDWSLWTILLLAAGARLLTRG